MVTRVRRLMHAVFCAAALCVLGNQAEADALALLNAEDRAQWQAVGRVNTAGFAARRGCSGTLIAPDLVVTAAHCVTGMKGAYPQHHFVAGWYRGNFIAHRAVDEVIVHPLYPLTRDNARFAYDLAVLILQDPIPKGLLKPVPLSDPNLPDADAILLLGYENARPHALSGGRDCPLRQVSERFRSYGCAVRNGASGGAVISIYNGAAALSGVIVARQGKEGHALTVPVHQWLRDQWHQAQDREKRRP